jgi:hypothetical protein
MAMLASAKSIAVTPILCCEHNIMVTRNCAIYTIEVTRGCAIWITLERMRHVGRMIAEPDR